VTISGITPGAHTVSFNTVSGWTAPDNVTVMIQASQTSSLSSTYAQGGGLNCFGGKPNESAKGDMLLVSLSLGALAIAASRRGKRNVRQKA
jgi:uncharacterized protein YraI